MIKILGLSSLTYSTYDLNSLLISTFKQMLAYIFIGLAVVLITLYFVTKKSGGQQKIIKPEVKSETSINKVVEVKKDYGKICIYFGSQTGTSAKLSEQLAQEATENGFQPQVIDLKNIHISHFEGTNRISIFLLSNTGEGDPPENTITFMNVLKLKEAIDEVKEIDWKKINFTIFGLGNTQYQHYNETGRVANKLFQKNRANRIYQYGEGDDNCSLEDDFNEWRKDLWPTLKKYRDTHELIQEEMVPAVPIRKIGSQMHGETRPLSKILPTLANFRIFIAKEDQKQEKINEDILDFKTKASLKAEKGGLLGVRQIRQNEKDGSTIQLEIQLQGQPEYQTAGNIALFSQNDPVIINQVIDYFKLKESDLNHRITVVEVNPDKKLKLNFVPNTLKSLLEQSIDLQGRITKSILKKMSKFQSNNQKYFLDNSSVKTTEQYKRITQKSQPQHWYNIFRLIKEYQVKLSFEDFIELSDSMAPRLFTIASHAKTQKNVIIAASLVEQGLISKFFLTKPQSIRAELKKSTFSDAMKWQKVIFIAAGTGVAPFRAFIQEKVHNIEQKRHGKEANVPIISLFFGCKHEHGDFIYKDEIMAWRDAGIIDRLVLAFSRDTEKKVYVQNLLEREEAELRELGHDKDSAIYICGSLPMGASIMQVLAKYLGVQKVKEMQKEGRIVKQLW